MKKIFIILGVIFVGILLALFLFGVFGGLAVVQIYGTYFDSPSRPIPLKTGTFNFAGYSGTYETPYLGCVTSRYDIVINNENDGETKICNNIGGGQTLTLSSSAKVENNLFTNYIKTKIILPKGTLQIDYNYNIFSHQPCTNNQIIFKVDNEVRGFKVACISGKDHSKSGSGSFEVILEEEKEIEISVLSNANNNYQTGSGTMRLDFEEKDPCEGVTCIDYCEDSTRNYNGRCVSGGCVYQTQTCVFGCIDGECNISIPERPPIVIQFFRDIWDWIKSIYEGLK